MVNTIMQGSAGNVLAALVSFVIPGVGQLLQGRLAAAIFFFIVAAFFWGMAALLGLITFGLLSWIFIIWHIFAALNCAVWKPRSV
ncbi:MAG: hypothetical protein ACFCU3_06820 [Verrucomicrobiales bacterium]